MGSQNGRAYAFDADRIALAGGALWYSTPPLGDGIQPGAAGMFALFGGIGDHILLGARTGASAQRSSPSMRRRERSAGLS